MTPRLRSALLLLCASRPPRDPLPRSRRRGPVAPRGPRHARHGPLGRAVEPRARRDGEGPLGRPGRRPPHRRPRPRRLHGGARLGGGALPDEPPLRLLGDPARLDAREELPARRLRRTDAGRGGRGARRGRAGPHPLPPRRRDRPRARAEERLREGEGRRRPLRGGGAREEGDRRRVREGARPALRRGGVRGRPDVPADGAGRVPRRAARLRAAAGRRRLRRRGGQLPLAAPHGGLLRPQGLRLAGRQARALLEGERAVPAEDAG